MAVLLAAGGISHATIIYRSTNEISSDSITASNYLASGFTTDDNSWTLDTVTMGMGGGGNNGGNFFVSIYNTVSGDPGDYNSVGDVSGIPGNYYGVGSVTGRPGTLMGVLFGEENPYIADEYIYVPTSLLTFEPNTTYCVVAEVTSGAGSYAWKYGDSSSIPEVGIYAGYSYSCGPDALWDAFGEGSPSVMTLNGTVVTGGSSVPEPATLIGFGMPMLMLGAGWLRRKSLK